jgi:lactoylglutathione lyase
MELVQVRLIVSDFPRMFRFYRDVLGFTPQVDDSGVSRVSAPRRRNAAFFAPSALLVVDVAEVRLLLAP